LSDATDGTNFLPASMLVTSESSIGPPG